MIPASQRPSAFASHPIRKCKPIFLDRNAVVAIKEFLIHPKYNSKIVTLRSLDKAGNRVHGMPSPIEERNNRPSNFHDTAEILTAFYSKAETDAYALDEKAGIATHFEVGKKDYSREELEAFHRSLSNILFRTRAKTDYQTLENRVFKCAKRLRLRNTHPFIIITLGVLYRNPSAKGVMKFPENEDTSENAVCDVLNIERIGKLRNDPDWMLVSKSKSRFVTFDKSLAKVWKSFNLDILSKNIARTSTQCPVDRAFFPDLDGDWTQFRNRIEKSADVP